MLFRSREAIPASELVLATECGGSDGNSGVTANPAVGVASDLLAISQRQSLHPAPVDLNDVVVHARDRHFPVELHLSLCIWSLGLVGRRVICLVPTLEER